MAPHTKNQIDLLRTGVRCDDSTDDSTKFLAFLDSADDGTVVKFPPGRRMFLGSQFFADGDGRRIVFDMRGSGWRSALGYVPNLVDWTQLQIWGGDLYGTGANTGGEPTHTDNILRYAGTGLELHGTRFFNCLGTALVDFTTDPTYDFGDPEPAGATKIAQTKLVGVSFTDCWVGMNTIGGSAGLQIQAAFLRCTGGVKLDGARRNFALGSPVESNVAVVDITARDMFSTVTPSYIGVVEVEEGQHDTIIRINAYGLTNVHALRFTDGQTEQPTGRVSVSGRVWNVTGGSAAFMEFPFSDLRFENFVTDADMKLQQLTRCSLSGCEFIGSQIDIIGSDVVATGNVFRKGASAGDAPVGLSSFSGSPSTYADTGNIYDSAWSEQVDVAVGSTRTAGDNLDADLS